MTSPRQQLFCLSLVSFSSLVFHSFSIPSSIAVTIWPSFSNPFKFFHYKNSKFVTDHGLINLILRFKIFPDAVSFRFLRIPN